MDDQPTCGRGLAEHAPLPSLMASVTDAVAEILELHLQSLDPESTASRPEFDAYVRVASAHRDAAERLREIGELMSGYRDLPMADHDIAALTDPRNARAFESFVKLERRLTTLLEQRLARDEEMLASMRT